MSSNGPGQERPWKPGDEANGHVLGPDHVWRPLHFTPAPRKPWYLRPLGVTGIVVGTLIVLGMGSAAAGLGDPRDGNSPDELPASSTSDGKASDVRSTTEDGAAPATPTASPTPKAEPKARPKPKPKPRTFLVIDVVDGDTIDLGNGQTVRLVGIDTPERGECGSQRASDNLARLVLGKHVRLAMSDEDTDRYGRLLRYVDVGSVDAGLSQIKRGYAIARYDSRDGYGFHPREPRYIKADAASKQYTCSKAKPAPLVGGGGGADCMTGYSPCLPVVSDLDCGEINGPVRVSGSDPYRLDADGDGIGCDS